ncbi:MAG: NUDIX hydrolase [Candidatus Eremiobacteraeota bacterium]|nr:NUDIX hydrolase [Candidatus Eremiobacteraeota bacterium]
MSGAGYVRRAKRVVYENPWLRFEAHDIVHPNGTAGVHGVVITPHASAVVLVDGDDVLLVRQARFAVDRAVLEVIKGGRHAGEDGLACAQRESREEAGVVAAQWHALGETYEIPSIVQEPVSLYLGTGLTSAPLAPEDVERIAVVRMRFADALDACADGRIDDAVTAIALLRAQRALLR